MKMDKIIYFITPNITEDFDIIIQGTGKESLEIYEELFKLREVKGGRQKNG